MKTVLDWLMDNRIACTLISFFIVLAFFLVQPQLRHEIVPNVQEHKIAVSVLYPGAAAKKVDTLICRHIEDALDTLVAIESVLTVAADGKCSATLDIRAEHVLSDVLIAVKNRIDAIDTLPADAEQPVVKTQTYTNNAVQILVTAQAGEASLGRLARALKAELENDPAISKVALDYQRRGELAIEVSRDAIIQYGLSLDEIGQGVAAFFSKRPVGEVQADNINFLVRSAGQPIGAEQLRQLVLKTGKNGKQVFLGDVARVRETFEEKQGFARLNGEPAVALTVGLTAGDNLTDIAAVASAFVEAGNAARDNVSLTLWADESEALAERLGILQGSAVMAVILVAILLALFLKPPHAVFVMVGLLLTILATLALFPLFDLSVNTLTIYGFIIAIGILVDDAIVIGERIHYYGAKNYSPKSAARRGTADVSRAVILGVATTIIVFIPFLNMPGSMSPFFQSLAWVVIIALIVSVLESHWLLPSHIAHYADWRWTPPGTGWFKAKLGTAMATGQSRYLAALRYSLHAPGRLVTVLVCVLALVLAYAGSGRMTANFFPAPEGAMVYATVQMPVDTSREAMQQLMGELERSAAAVAAEYDGEDADPTIVATYGLPVFKPTVLQDGAEFNPGLVEVAVKRAGGDRAGARAFARRWREVHGPVVGAMRVDFRANLFEVPAPIAYDLSGGDERALVAATRRLKDELDSLGGVLDIRDDQRGGREEVELTLTRQAQLLGFSLDDVLRQLGSAIHGFEVDSVARGGEIVDVVVRLPRSQRASLDQLADFPIKTTAGVTMPLASIAHIDRRFGAPTITRNNGLRTISVTADVDTREIGASEVAQRAETDIIPAIESAFPGVRVLPGGQLEEAVEVSDYLLLAFALAMMAIYGLMATVLRSYLYPLIVMATIPLAAVGALLGHIVLGVDLVIFSLLGIIALAGVVVNGNLVLIDSFNHHRRHLPRSEAVVRACGDRFQPIVLTTATTFVGLAPLIFQRGPAVDFILGMAVSLGGGVVFALPVTLLVTPVLIHAVAGREAAHPAPLATSSQEPVEVQRLLSKVV